MTSPEPLPTAPVARTTSCRICGGSEGRDWLAREMMFGIREAFRYFECADCGCLQMAEPPPDLSRFYPDDYYSLDVAPARITGLKGFLRDRRNGYAFTGEGLLGRLLHRWLPYPLPGISNWLARIGGNRESRILDVGCGTGYLIYDLALSGFRNLLGVDPFVAGDIHYDVGATVLKREISEIGGEFDLIIFNHSIEHVSDPVGTFRAVRNRLARGGLCVARTPTVSSYAWEHYRTDWVQLDAPRHLAIHSVESMRRAAESAGLQLTDVVYDSTDFQFVGSELYRRDIPYVQGVTGVTRWERQRYRHRARRLNRERRGDQATFFLTHPPSDSA